MINTAVLVTIVIFMGGVIFSAGRLVARIEKLEEWRIDMRGDIKEIRGLVGALSDLVKASLNGRRREDGKGVDASA